MTASMTATTCVADHERPHQLQKLQKLKPHDCAIVVAAKTGEDVELPAVPRPHGLQNNLQLDLEAHRRWNTSVLPTSRLPKSPCEPTDASSPRHHAAYPTFKVERCFAEFEEMRENVLKSVSHMPQCTCQYCMDFLVYIRYKYSQPRGIAKLTTGMEKRKQILTTFINDFVAMGQRQAPKLGKRKCEAQKLVPALLEAFLLSNARDC
ncbi:hypothetical protein PI124_g10899 [Phytophthora idaei]|nr:hypothetical protein PI124_g10899 [Phytophthora idaei]